MLEVLSFFNAIDLEHKVGLDFLKYHFYAPIFIFYLKNFPSLLIFSGAQFSILLIPQLLGSSSLSQLHHFSEFSEQKFQMPYFLFFCQYLQFCRKYPVLI